MDYESESYVIDRIEYKRILSTIHYYWGLKDLLLAQPAEVARYTIQRILR